MKTMFGILLLVFCFMASSVSAHHHWGTATDTGMRADHSETQPAASNHLTAAEAEAGSEQHHSRTAANGVPALAKFSLAGMAYSIAQRIFNP